MKIWRDVDVVILLLVVGCFLGKHYYADYRKKEDMRNRTAKIEAITRKWPTFNSNNALAINGNSRKEHYSGTYTGFCRNTSSGIEAPITLALKSTIISSSDRSATGSLSINSTELAGGGDFRGKIRGNVIRFTTKNPDIHWEGRINNGAIEGTYVARQPVSNGLIVEEAGTWQVGNGGFHRGNTREQGMEQSLRNALGSGLQQNSRP